MSVGTQALAEMRGEAEKPEPVEARINDAQIAYDLRKAVDVVNVLLNQACEAGISVKLDARTMQFIAGAERVTLAISISKAL